MVNAMNEIISDSGALRRTVVFLCLFFHFGSLWSPSRFSEKVGPLSRPWDGDVSQIQTRRFCIKCSKQRYCEEQQMDSATSFISLQDSNKRASGVTSPEKLFLS